MYDAEVGLNVHALSVDYYFLSYFHRRSPCNPLESCLSASLSITFRNSMCSLMCNSNIFIVHSSLHMSIHVESMPLRYHKITMIPSKTWADTLVLTTFSLKAPGLLSKGKQKIETPLGHLGLKHSMCYTEIVAGVCGWFVECKQLVIMIIFYFSF